MTAKIKKKKKKREPQVNNFHQTNSYKLKMISLCWLLGVLPYFPFSSPVYFEFLKN